MALLWPGTEFVSSCPAPHLALEALSGSEARSKGQPPLLSEETRGLEAFTHYGWTLPELPSGGSWSWAGFVTPEWDVGKEGAFCALPLLGYTLALPLSSGMELPDRGFPTSTSMYLNNLFCCYCLVSDILLW